MTTFLRPTVRASTPSTGRGARAARAARPGLVALVATVALLGAACGGEEQAPDTRPPVTVGAFNFSESAILAHVYAGALESAGFRPTVRVSLGNREVVAPAIERGDIDVYPGYAATELEFFNSGAAEATPDPTATVDRLRERLGPRGLTALTPSPAVDSNAFVVTRSTADRLGIATLSDLARVAGQLTLGGPPECPARPFCIPGLQQRYGIRFKDFRPLDAGGPLSKTALANADVDVALIFSSDGFISANGLVVLADDKALQNADNVVPIVRNDAVTDALREALDRVSGALSTETLTQLNARADVDKEDPADVASDWLAKNGFGRKDDPKR